MRIGIDADRAWANRFGIGRFVREVVQALQEECPDHEYLLFSLTRAPASTRRAFSPARLLRGIRRFLWLQTSLPRQAERRAVDVLFYPDYLISFRPPCPVVAVVHDLLFVSHPRWGEGIVNRQLRLCVPVTIARADRLIVPSDWVRRELVGTFHCSPERVRVIPEGVGSQFQPLPRERVEETLSRYGLSRTPFLLSVGMWSPRKNLARLLEAFASLRSWYEGKLVLLGGGGWSYRPLQDAIRKYRLTDRVILAGYVPDEDLPAFYNGADVFVFPSLYEGFGLPVLEAMACGCPVVASNTTAIPEVAGPAAALVDPHDAPGFARAIRDLLQDQGRYAQYRQAGLDQAQRYRWSSTARQLECLFREVCR